MGLLALTFVLLLEQCLAQPHAVLDLQAAATCYHCDTHARHFPACLSEPVTCHPDEACSISYGTGLPTIRCQKSDACLHDVSHPIGGCTGGGVEVHPNQCELCCHTTACVQGINGLLLQEFPQVGVTVLQQGPVTCYHCDQQTRHFPGCLSQPVTCRADEVCSISYGIGLPFFRCEKSNDCVRDVSHPMRTCAGGGVEVQTNECELCCSSSACMNDISGLLLQEFPYQTANQGIFCPGSCPETDIATCVHTATYCHADQFCEVGIDDHLIVQGHCKNAHELQKCHDDLARHPCALTVGQPGHIAKCIWDCCQSKECLAAHFGAYMGTPAPQVLTLAPLATPAPTHVGAGQIHIILSPLLSVDCFHCDSHSRHFPGCLSETFTCQADEVCSITYGNTLPSLKCQKINDCTREVSHPTGHCVGGGVEVRPGQCEICCLTTACVNNVNLLLLQEFPHHGIFCPGICSERDIATCVKTAAYCHTDQYCEVGINELLVVHGQCKPKHDIQLCYSDKVRHPCPLAIGQAGHTARCVWDCCLTIDCLIGHFGAYMGFSTHSQTTVHSLITTPKPTTPAPTTPIPTTPKPTTPAPTTPKPTTPAPTTPMPTTPAPTTPAPTTPAPTTPAPTTPAPTTPAPTTPKPTTQAPTTAAPTTTAPASSTAKIDEPLTCVKCDGTCRGNEFDVTCPDGFCSLTLQDDMGGNRIIKKGCSNQNKCMMFWMEWNSDQLCQNIIGNPGNPSYQDVSCTFCCTGERCNADFTQMNVFRGVRK
ncbi:unnamed protein product [Lymnaea stagnalis]|uniref:Uncharacterized protein n=1 Tax=Lymnaea stagnalis TaxID=6523 RepID=A0AAV2I2J8_LYMST